MLKTILKRTTVSKYFHTVQFRNNPKMTPHDFPPVILRRSYVNNCSNRSIATRLAAGKSSRILANCLKQ